MNIIHDPKVYLVGKQVVNQEALDNFLKDNDYESWTTDTNVDAQKLCEVAGRNCYGKSSFLKPRPGGNKAYLDNIISSGHHSVIEAAVYNFIFTNISRSLSLELVRHRTNSYSQASQRYIEGSDGYIEPEVIANDEEAHQIWLNAMQAIDVAYSELSFRLQEVLSKNPLYKDYDKTSLRKEVRQAARSVLPNATETKIFFTANVRSIRHFLEMRCSRFADVEIRKLAFKVYEIMIVEAPNLFKDYQVVKLSDNTNELISAYKKV